MHITISDPGLRDGNHAIAHQLSLEQIRRYAQIADQSGIDIIEVGHGNGLGASSLQLGLAPHSDKDMLRCAREHIQNAKLGIHIIPGFGRLSDLDLAMDEGVDIYRVAAHCSEADTTERYIDHLIKHGQEAHGALMMSHMASKDSLLVEARKMASYGAKAVILMDSAGAFIPLDVSETVSWLTAHLDIAIGFHAHNNLGLSIANSIAAVQAGASMLDATIKGFGAGAGNTPLEVLIAVLEKYAYKTRATLDRVLDLADQAEDFLVKKTPSINSRNICSGIHGIFSGFDKPVALAAIQYQLLERDIYRELGKRKIIAGQEDMIMDICESLLVRSTAIENN